MVNYIRKCTSQLKCCYCKVEFDEMQLLTEHIDAHDNTELCLISAIRELWDVEEYMFSTYENDPLLTILDDIS